MLFAAGAAMSAIDALSSLFQTGSSSAKTGFATPPSQTFSPTTNAGTQSSPPATGFSGGLQLSPDTFNALLQAQSQSQPVSASPSDAFKDLFNQLDGNGDGSISKSEFENALGAGGTNVQAADDVFAKLDTNGDGSVSQDELSAALKGGHHHHHHAGGAGGSGGADQLMQALDGASSTSSTNSDGSTTTTVTYADGSKVSMTTPAQASNGNSAASSYNLTELLIQRQAQALAASAQSSLSMQV